MKKIICDGYEVKIDMNVEQAIETLEKWLLELSDKPGNINLNALARIQAMEMVLKEINRLRTWGVG